MEINCRKVGEKAKELGHTLGVALHDFDAQCLRVLRCTARALAHTPGGLRFKPGSRPWLEEVSVQGSKA
ncbi:MAG: hypothetical protein WCK83_15230 [Burkholderiales bacterium]